MLYFLKIKTIFILAFFSISFNFFIYFRNNYENSLKISSSSNVKNFKESYITGVRNLDNDGFHFNIKSNNGFIYFPSYKQLCVEGYFTIKAQTVTATGTPKIERFTFDEKKLNLLSPLGISPLINSCDVAFNNTPLKQHTSSIGTYNTLHW